METTEAIISEERDMEEIRTELVKDFPTKIARKRAKQIVVNRVWPDAKPSEIQSYVVHGLLGVGVMA